MSETPTYEFGPFRLNVKERLLTREGKSLALTPKTFDTLVLLVRRRGHLVEKEELLRTLWPDTVVEEANLTNNIWALRKTLQGGRYIETLPKQGYRFVAEVREIDKGDEELIIEEHTFRRTTTLQEEEEIERTPRDDLFTEQVLSIPGLEKQSLTANKVLTAGLVCLILASVVVVIYHPWSRAKTISGIPAAPNSGALKSIAVLPFKTIGSGVDNEYLGLGLTDALITKLGNQHQIIVRPTSAVRRYGDPQQDPIVAGRQQQVDAVLDGSVQQSGDRLRLTVQLIRVADATTLWSGHFDERFTDIFTVQDSISDRVTCDLIAHVCDSDNGGANGQKQINIAAYQAYLKGRYFWNKRNVEGLQKGVDYFNQAIALDHNYARAYAGLADSYIILGGYFPPGELTAKAKVAAEQAIVLDPTLAEPHASLGLIAMNYDWDWSTSEQEFKRAIELNPNYPTAHHWYAEYLAAVGRRDESISEIEHALALDPLSLIINTDKGKMLIYARRYSEAIDQLHKTLEMQPDYFPALGYLTMAVSVSGNYVEAKKQIENLKLIDADAASVPAAWLEAVQGRTEEARRVVGRLERTATKGYVDPNLLLSLYIALDDKDRSFVWLEKGYNVHSTLITSLKVNPIYDSLRVDPRFALFMRRVRLAATAP